MVTVGEQVLQSSHTQILYDVELTFCSFLSKFTYSKNLKTGTIHLKIIDHASTYPQLKIKESFHIEQLKPELNKQVEHVSLSLHF